MEWMWMPLKRYADFSGRSRRMEFWMWQLFKFLVGCVIAILFMALFGTALAGFNQTKDPAALMAVGGGLLLLWLICMVIGLAIFIPDLAVTVRRLHDTNRSGWWILAPMAPYLLFWVVVMMTMEVGKAGPPSGAAGIVALVAILAAGALALTLLVFYFLDGTPGPNRFGPDPKGREGATFS